MKNSKMTDSGDTAGDWHLVPTSCGMVRVPNGFEVVLYTGDMRARDVLWRFNSTGSKYDCLGERTAFLPPGLIIRCHSNKERDPNDALAGKEDEVFPSCEYLSNDGGPHCEYPLPTWAKHMIPDGSSALFTAKTCRGCAVRFDLFKEIEDGL